MRNLTTFILFLLAFTANARQISPDEAAAIASDFLNSSSLQIANARRIGVKRARAKSDTDGKFTSPYYVFNGEGNQGFVIISGDDRAKKILGYSDAGNFDFDNLPPQLAAMLDQYAEQIASLPESAAADPSWSAPPRDASTEEGKLLETANWGQGYPYNAQCPVIDGVQCPTGCVATAMAIVMKYHNWPGTYDWDAMPMEKISDNNVHISKLMADIGMAINMEYGPTESLAYSGLISQIFYDTFNYSYTAETIGLGAGHISHEDWGVLIKKEIDANRPIIYIGSGISSHAFVLDGYNSLNMYHINWGWDASYNGYFDLSYLTPYDGANFSDGQGMTIGIKPISNKETQYSKSAYIDYGYLHGTKCFHGFGLNPEISDIKKGEEFHMSYATLNVKPQTWFGVALIDKESNIKQIINQEFCSNEHSDDDSGFLHYLGECKGLIEVDINPEDKLQLIAREDESSQWLPVRGTLETPASCPVNDIRPQLCHIDWKVVPGIEIRYHHCNSTYEGIIEDIAKGTLLDIYAYSKNPGTVTISINGLYKFSDISGWEYGKIGSTAGTYCIDDSLSIEVGFIPASEYLDLEVKTDIPGELESKLDGYDLSKIKKLKIEGLIDNRDFVFIRTYLSKLETIDISKCKITEYEKFKSDHLPNSAFSGMWLSNVKLPQINVIEEMAFSGLNRLYDIELPKSVCKIEENAFYFCANLKRIVFKNPVPFEGTKNSLPDWLYADGFIVVPKGSIEAYKNAPYAEECYRRILEGELVPATAIKLSKINPTDELNAFFVLSENFKIEFEPENSTDYVVWASDDHDISTANIYATDNNLVCSICGRNEESKKQTTLYIQSSSGASNKYIVNSIPPISSFTISDSILCLNQGEEYTLVHQINPCEYPVGWMSDNYDVASVDLEGKITAHNAGEAIITGSCEDAYGVHTLSCHVTVRKPAKGDSNANGTVNIADAVNTANYAVGIEVENFCFEAADINEDNRITLSDASGTVTILLESPVEEAVPAMFKVSDKSVADGRDGLVIDDYVAMADRSSSVFVSLDNTTDYVALQADVTVPEGMTLNTVKPGKRIGAGHSLMTRRVDERTMRIALFNPNNVPFANNDEPILELVVKGDNAHSGDIEIRNIIASDAKAGEYRLQSMGGHCLGTTAIGAGKGDGIGIGTGGKAIHIHNAQGQEIAIYSLDGRMVSRFTATSEHESRRVDAGLYIVTVGNETFTLIVK